MQIKSRMLKIELFSGILLTFFALLPFLNAEANTHDNKTNITDDIFTFKVFNSTSLNQTCLIARFSADFQIFYLSEQDDAITINMTEPTNYTGTCMKNNVTLNITFANDWHLNLIYSMDKSDYALTSIKLNYTISSDLFPNATNGSHVAEKQELSEFSVAFGKSYKCYSPTKIELNKNVTIEFRNYQAQVFIDSDKNKNEFDTAVECVADIVGSNRLVPIIIGIILIILVALVLVAYVVGRRRYRPTYQQV